MPEDWARQSACEVWTVGDVVAHLVEPSGPLPDQIERGLAGDLSPTPGFAGEHPSSEDQFRLDLNPGAISLRRELGTRLLAELTNQNREFDRVLVSVGPEDWKKLCDHRVHPETVRSKADIRIAELAMHEWDIHWAFDTSARLAQDSVPGLVSASGRAVRRAFRRDPSRPGPVRYRFEVSGELETTIDLVLSPEGVAFENTPSGGADIVFRCSASTYAMVVFGRLKMGAAIEEGLVVLEGDQKLADEFIAAYVGG